MIRARTTIILITLIVSLINSPGRSAEVPPGMHHPCMLTPGPAAFSPAPAGINLFVDDDFLPTDPQWGITHFGTIGDALIIAGGDDMINIYDGIYTEQVTINASVSLVAIPGEYPVMDGTGLLNSTGVTIAVSNVTLEGLTIINYENSIKLTSSGDALINQCRIYDNLVYGILNENATASSDASNCWWGASSGPYDPSDDRTTGGLYNPEGLGNLVSDHTSYYPWSVNDIFTQQPVEFGIFNTGCGSLEARLKPLTDITSTTSMIQFALRWAGEPGIIDNVSSPEFNLSLAFIAANINGYNYALFTSDNFTPLSCLAGNELIIMSVELNGTGSGFSNFEVITDSWTVANNANPYLELMGTDFSGFAYHYAEDAYLDDCDNAELRVRALLEGPYDSLTDVMRTDLNEDIPLNQPYYYPPWFYAGPEALGSVPANMVDWVLVELRSTPTGPAIDRSAGMITDDGTILDASMAGPIRFDGITASSPYYVVVHHRNHLPVMSLDPVIVPNIGPYNFTDTLNFPPYGTGVKAMSKLETGVYGLIAGDVNNDGKLKYSGPQNDRGLIMDMIYFVTGSPVITQTITGYYKEDLTMDHVVKYSGPGNDQREIILNLVDLTGSTLLTSTFQCVVPGYAASAPEHGSPIAAEMNSDYVDVGIFDYGAPDELVIKARPDHNIPGYGLTNIQFTIRWPETSNVFQLWPTANTINSLYNILPQGPVTLADGYYHQVFAAANNTIIDWTAGNEYAVLVLKYFYTVGDCTEFEITNDSWTVDNNGTYYFEVIGQNRTGIMYEPLLQIVSEGGYVEGSQDICLGTSTGILLLMDYSGTVIKWQKRYNAGAWSDIPGTAGVINYNETPGLAGTYEYRAQVQHFGCTPEFSEPAIIQVQRYVIWSGNVNNNWNDPANWNECGIPTLLMDVQVPNVSPNPFPYVNVDGYCRTITIQTGATVTISLTGSITVGDNPANKAKEKIPILFKE